MKDGIGRASSGRAVDGGAAAVAVVFLVLTTRHIPVHASARPLDALGYALLVVGGGSLAFCRRRPEMVVAVVTVVLSTYLLCHYAGGPIYITGWISLLFLSWRSTRRAGTSARRRSPRRWWLPPLPPASTRS